MKKLIFIIVIITMGTPLTAQQVDHYETVVMAESEWKYFPGVSDPGSQWYTNDFDDTGWPAGTGGFGYGDGDDGTEINPVLSVFLRKSFDLADTARIEKVFLNMDYDDGFIAYLNGVEIARSTMPGTEFVSFDTPSAGLHEALLYRGIPPENFTVPTSLLRESGNSLAIQVHNHDLSSSDLSSNAYLTIGVSDSDFIYPAAPDWFEPPVQLDSSRLPVLIIDTQGATIPDEPKITATMKVLNSAGGTMNYLTDSVYEYNGYIGIEIRGESAQGFPKKSYAVETRDSLGENNNVSLLGLPVENDWILYGPYSDKSLIRNVLAMYLGRATGRYASRTKFCEVILNGEYIGLYILMEKIKRDNNRVDIATLNPDEVSGNDLTGGYLLKVDKFDFNDDPGWTSFPSPSLPGESAITFQYHDPEPDELVSVQKAYIQDYIYELESALSGRNYSSAGVGYHRYIDVESFIDFMIVNEVSKNIDAYIFSTYMFKDRDDRNSRLQMGPLWDFNLAFGNLDYLENSQFAPGWTYNDDYRMYWFRRLMTDSYFASRFTCRWEELSSILLNREQLGPLIDGWVEEMGDAVGRNFRRWPVLGTYVWPNQFIGNTHSEEIQFLKNWLYERIDWINQNKPGECRFITGLEDKDNGFPLRVYPNPSGNQFNFEVGVHENCLLVITDQAGRILLRNKMTTGEFTWKPEDLPPGVYLYRVMLDSRIMSGKLIKY